MHMTLTKSNSCNGSVECQVLLATGVTARLPQAKAFSRSNVQSDTVESLEAAHREA